MFKINFQKKSGFTLIELLLYMGVSATVLLIVSVFLVMLWQSKIKNQTIAEVEQQGAYVMRKITQSINDSSSIGNPLPGEVSQVLNLVTNSSSTNPSIWNLEDGIVKLSEGGTESYALNSQNVIVSDLEFANLSSINTPGLIRISFTVSFNNQSGQKEYQYQTIFYDSISLRR